MTITMPGPSYVRCALLATLLALAGCTQIATPLVADSPASAVQPAAPEVDGARPPPRMSRPLPAPAVPDPVQLDHSCRVASDCAVKNVGSCCGAMPACVNKDSPADPAAVQAQCAKQGRMSSCGFRAGNSCGCVQGRCVSDDKTPVGGWINDPSPPPDPVR